MHTDLSCFVVLHALIACVTLPEMLFVYASLLCAVLKDVLTCIKNIRTIILREGFYLPVSHVSKAARCKYRLGLLLT